MPQLESLRLLDDSLSQSATELVIQGVSERQTTDTQQYTELIQHWSQQRAVCTAVYVYYVITVIIVLGYHHDYEQMRLLLLDCLCCLMDDNGSQYNNTASQISIFENIVNLCHILVLHHVSFLASIRYLPFHIRFFDIIDLARTSHIAHQIPLPTY